MTTLKDWKPRANWRQILIFVLLAAIAIGAEFRAEVANNGVNGVDNSVRRGLTGVIEGQIRNCQEDLKFRRQYKIRGEAELKLLELFVTLAEKQVQDPTSQRFLEEFRPLVAKIRVIPVPDCREAGTALEKVLKKNGLDLPDRDTGGGDAIQPTKGHQPSGPEPGPITGGQQPAGHGHSHPTHPTHPVTPSNPGGGNDGGGDPGNSGGGNGHSGNPPGQGSSAGKTLENAGHIVEEVAKGAGEGVGQTTEQVGQAADHAAEAACEKAHAPVVCP